MSGPEEVAKALLPAGWKLQRSRRLQSLWAGFGSVHELQCTDGAGSSRPLILKLVAPPRRTRRQKEEEEDEGTLRKLFSYEVELFFYSEMVPRMRATADGRECMRTGDCIGSTYAARRSDANQPIALLLEDLRPSHPRSAGKRGTLDEAQSFAALRWLANFHGFWREHLDQFADKTFCAAPLEEARLRKADPGRARNTAAWQNGGYT